ncbi:MAG: DUF4097 family beta strand repeat-containing protein [Coprobacillaceae bacterium]
MRNTTKVLIGILLAIVVGLVSILIYVLGFGGRISLFEDRFQTKLINTQTVSMEEVSNISIQGYSSEIVFIETESEEMTIKEYGTNMIKGPFVNVDKKGEQLYLEVDEDAFRTFIILGSNHKYFEVYLPSSYQGSLDVETNSGDIESKMNLELSNCKIQASSGYIDLQKVKSENILLSTSSGDIDVKELEGKSEVKASSGYINMERAIGDINSSANSGDITLKNIIVNIEVETSSGYIDVEHITGNVTASAQSGDINLDKVEGMINLKTTSGYIEAYGITGAGDITTSSGDIELRMTTLTNNLNLQTSSGYIDCELPKDTSFAFEANSNSGDIETDFEDDLNYNKDGSSVKGNIGDTSDITINLETSSGDIELSLK